MTPYPLLKNLKEQLNNVGSQMWHEQENIRDEIARQINSNVLHYLLLRIDD